MPEKERKHEERKREEMIFPERPGDARKKIKNLVKAVHRYESREQTSRKRHNHLTDYMITPDSAKAVWKPIPPKAASHTIKKYMHI
jgi:hypothetical protein